MLVAHPSRLTLCHPHSSAAAKILARTQDRRNSASSRPCPIRLGGMCRLRPGTRPQRPPVVIYQTIDRRRTFMSDYRNSEFDYRNDPLRRDPAYDPDARAMNATWGWIAAAVFIVVVLAVAFGIGHEPNQSGTNTAANDVTPPAATRMAPPLTAGPTAATPAPAALTPNSP